MKIMLCGSLSPRSPIHLPATSQMDISRPAQHSASGDCKRQAFWWPCTLCGWICSSQAYCLATSKERTASVISGSLPCLLYAFVSISAGAMLCMGLLKTMERWATTKVQDSKMFQTRKHLLKHTHTHTHTYIHACMHTYIHACMHAYVRTYIHTCMHACMHACMHTYVHTYINTYINTYIHTYLHTYIHTYIHTACLPPYLPPSLPPYLPTYPPTYIRTYVLTYILTDNMDIDLWMIWNDHFCIWNCEAASPYASKRDKTEGPRLGRTEKLWSEHDAETHRCLEQICDMWEDLPKKSGARWYESDEMDIDIIWYYDMRIDQFNWLNYV